MSKVAVINGACSAIGLASAKKLAQEGYFLCLLGRNRTKFEKMAPILSDIPHKFYEADVVKSDYKKIGEKIINDYKRIDAFINSVGVVPVGDMFLVSDDDWSLAIETNLMGTIRSTRAISEIMCKQGLGSIVLVSGMLALQPESILAVGGVCAAAINNFAKSASKLLGPKGIRINVVNAGATESPLQIKVRKDLSDILGADEGMIHNELTEKNPLGRIAIPEDIANTITFLCSDKASYINGAFIAQDGSYSSAY